MENKRYSDHKKSNSQRSNSYKKKTYSNTFQKKERSFEGLTKPKNESQKTDGFLKKNNTGRFVSENLKRKIQKQHNNHLKKDKPFLKKSDDNFADTEKDLTQSAEMRLNKFIANAGICSRRNADIYISAGNVEVNGQVMTTLGYRVQPTDVVKFDGKIISSEKKVYILLNKPKGFITTTNDEKGRKTVMDLVANATSARILPVGRLDRPTTGLLLLTNDGDLAKKLTHPTHGVRKIYHVVLDKKLDYKDFLKIEHGLELEDGFIQVDEISYVNDKPKNEIGVKIHSGKNRIVRRIFEHLGYNVEKLDRVVFAGLTKKDLPRGHWRRLTQQEIINLKNIK